MGQREEHQHTVSVDIWCQGQDAVLDWVVYRARVGDGCRRPWKRRRVLIRDTGPLSVPQLTALAGRMVAFVLSGQPGTAHVRRGLSWQEVGATGWAVPPGGGEGGASRTADATVTEGLIRS